MIEPSKSWKWRVDINGHPLPAPYAVTSGFLLDNEGNFPLILRGPHVRSAKNAWSLPSGLHECGFTLEEQLAAEAREELCLEQDTTWKSITLGTYENIAAEDNWHWVISVLAMKVKTLDTLVNSEPDKHPEIRKVNIFDVCNGNVPIDSMKWTPGLLEFIKTHVDQAADYIRH